jgi:hypothetical protein
MEASPTGGDRDVAVLHPVVLDVDDEHVGGSRETHWHDDLYFDTETGPRHRQ